MTNPITRRTALAVPVTLPLLPLTAYAAPADPVVVAYNVWLGLDAERRRLQNVYAELEDRHGPVAKEAEAYSTEFITPACHQRRVIEECISEMVATTPAGLAAQLTIAVDILGCGEGPACYETEDRLLLAALAGAERMAGVAS